MLLLKPLNFGESWQRQARVYFARPADPTHRKISSGNCNEL